MPYTASGPFRPTMAPPPALAQGKMCQGWETVASFLLGQAAAGSGCSVGGERGERRADGGQTGAVANENPRDVGAVITSDGPSGTAAYAGVRTGALGSPAVIGPWLAHELGHPADFPLVAASVSLVISTRVP